MRQELFSGHILKLVLLDGKWEIVEHAPGVAVLIRRGRQVLGVRQKRRAIGRETWEIPAGLVDAGEQPHEAAAREAAEEVQLGGRLELVARFHSSPGFTDEELFLYEMHDAKPVEGQPDPGEDLVIEWRDAAEVWQQVLSGQLATSSLTALALKHVLDRP